MDWLHKYHLQERLKDINSFVELKLFIAQLIDELPEEPNPEDE